MASKRELFRNLALLAATILVCLLIFEVGLRVFYPIYPSAAGYSRTLGWVHHPNSRAVLKDAFNPEYEVEQNINSKRLRDYEYEYNKPENTFRILVLGDSFTHGDGAEMEETYPKVLERMLNREEGGEGTGVASEQHSQAGMQYQVINAGARGYSTCQEWAYLAYEGMKYEPDLVLVGFFLNDITDNMAPPKSLICVEDGDGLKLEKLPLSLSLSARGYLGAYSHLYILGWRAKAAYDNSRMETSGEKGEDMRERFLQNYDPEGKPEMEAAWAHTEKIFIEIKKTAEAGGADTALIIIPAREQVDARKYAETIEAYGLEEREIGLDYVNERILAFGDGQDIRVLDLLPVLRAENTDNSFYYEVDGHWRPSGHLVAAEEIYGFLYSEGLLEEAMVEEEGILK